MDTRQSGCSESRRLARAVIGTAPNSPRADDPDTCQSIHEPRGGSESRRLCTGRVRAYTCSQCGPSRRSGRRALRTGGGGQRVLPPRSRDQHRSQLPSRGRPGHLSVDPRAARRIRVAQTLHGPRPGIHLFTVRTEPAVWPASAADRRRRAAGAAATKPHAWRTHLGSGPEPRDHQGGACW